ncbi:hypothetical protein [Gordonia westfalica]|uniref:Uncharacterized protein n=1 Tax=Gordonia westfalica TaxID=158898 RepID=A0A1H2M1A1_9ACTN|nr:hypothetical protein [Gordonia westfalica]SDU87017.1 hypothetical protein SAMN04488548_1372 [Gordonia westfalica]
MDDEGNPWMSSRSKMSADLKFDAAMASVLSWKACLDARKSGLDPSRSECHVASTERVVHDSGDAAEWLPVLTAVWMLRSRESVCCVATLTATPRPEMGKNVRASWQRFQRQSRVNLATKISSSLAERLIPTVLMLAPTRQLMWSAAQRIWRDNRIKGVSLRSTITC